MRAERAKQLLKNAVYRTIGETATTLGVIDAPEIRTLRVLMYHKINDKPENPVTVRLKKGSQRSTSRTSLQARGATARDSSGLSSRASVPELPISASPDGLTSEVTACIAARNGPRLHNTMHRAVGRRRHARGRAHSKFPRP